MRLAPESEGGTETVRDAVRISGSAVRDELALLVLALDAGILLFAMFASQIARQFQGAS
jgi:hypothetical protein